MANRNALYAQILIDELARSGLRAVCAAPGSRHTPLMLAFAQHPNIRVYSHLDERSAAFFALGLALASGQPVALVCTSGTAGANMYPAVIEAHQSRVPLIVLTADRPHELRGSGANQTIDQIRLFGEYALWSVDMPLPEAQPSAVFVRYLRTTMNRAYATANGLRKGVVHLNIPFRKPLEPTPVEGDMTELPDDTPSHAPQSQLFTGARWPVPNYNGAEPSAFKAFQNPKGVVIAGVNAGYDTYFDDEDIIRFAELMKYPLLVDPISGLRVAADHIVAGYDTFCKYLKTEDYPEVIVRFGNVPVSKSLNALIANANPEYYIHFSPSGEWSDDAHLVTHVLRDEMSVRMMEPVSRDAALNARYAALEKITWDAIENEITTGAYFDGAVAYDVVDLIPYGSTLFAGNSLPVRLLDQFGKPQPKRIHTYANRGASGIDGNISTALGAGAGRPDAPLVALIGDVTFYHDMNGLLAVHRCGVPITLVLLNNDGGGIFHRLPIKDYEPEFTQYFVTPHGLDFSHAAALYGLDYVTIDARESGARDAFRQVFGESVNGRKSSIIEVRTDAQHDLQRRDQIVAAAGERIKQLGL